jgi:hypothetical protein
MTTVTLWSDCYMKAKGCSVLTNECMIGDVTSSSGCSRRVVAISTDQHAQQYKDQHA